MVKNVALLVSKFSKDMISRRELLKELNPAILKIPLQMGYYDEDIKHEFYARIISKIHLILPHYKEVYNKSFQAWFKVVLRHDFIHFIRKWNSDNLINTDFKNLIAQELIQNENNCNNEKFFSENFNSINFTEREKKVIALKFGIKISDVDISDTVNKILDKLEKKKALQNKISNKFIKIINLHKILSNETDISKILILKKKEFKLKSSKRRFEKIFNSFNILPTNGWVGKKLGLKEGTIAAYLNKIKLKFIKNDFKKFLTENN
jgi:hypothetical protein